MNREKSQQTTNDVPHPLAEGAFSAAEDHHSALWAELVRLGDALVTAVADGRDASIAREELVAYLAAEVEPHLATERTVLHGLARGAGLAHLAAALELDHRAMERQVQTLATTSSDLTAALAARALLLLFALRMEKEETVLLPALAEAGIDVAEVLAWRPEVVGSQ